MAGKHTSSISKSLVFFGFFNNFPEIKAEKHEIIVKKIWTLQLGLAHYNCSQQEIRFLWVCTLKN